MRDDAHMHPGIVQALAHLQHGRITRREFLRVATLLGASLSSASLLAACGGGQSDSSSEQGDAAGQSATPVPVKRGGVLRVGIPIHPVDHPARFWWSESSHIFRFVFEYLTQTDAENITHPLLLERWQPNDDLTVWTLTLRQGVVWSNGDELVADHVVFTFNEWLNPDTKSSMYTLWEGFLTPEGIEATDDYTITLTLDAPKLDVPEILFHYPAHIIHPDFDGNVASGNNPGTGPYMLEDYRAGVHALLKRREDYWQQGADGQPLPYLDEITFVDLGDDRIEYVLAIKSGDMHTIYAPDADTIEDVREEVHITVMSVDTAQTRVLRMRVDQEPWQDVRVRQALKKCQNRADILERLPNVAGLVGHDCHVSPVQPDCAAMDDAPAYDPEGAKQLLADAGYPDGLEVTLSIGGWNDVLTYAESLQEHAAEAGFTITLETMSDDEYWEKWTEWNVGITPWSHRPLGSMMLPLAYAADADGNPVPWNETRWVDEEFNEVLKQAQGTLDVEARKALMATLQRIQMERGSVGVAFWGRVWEVFHVAFQGVQAHPLRSNLWLEVWYDLEVENPQE